MKPYHIIAPDTTLDWVFDWSEYLADGDSIIEHEWRITPVHSSSPPVPELIGPGNASVIVRGLQLGHTYTLTNRIFTQAGFVDERSLILRCAQT